MHRIAIQPRDLSEFDSANGNHTQDHGKHIPECGPKRKFAKVSTEL